jgi:hypothetical protein
LLSGVLAGESNLSRQAAKPPGEKQSIFEIACNKALKLNDDRFFYKFFGCLKFIRPLVTLRLCVFALNKLCESRVERALACSSAVVAEKLDNDRWRNRLKPVLHSGNRFLSHLFLVYFLLIHIF